MDVIDLLTEYDRHASEATSERERKRFEKTRATLDAFRACFEEDFPGVRVRIALVLGDDE
jgi:hypothetical protein